MHELSTFFLASMEQIIFVTICLSGVGFLIRFLLALLLDEKRRRKARLGDRKNRTFAAPMRIDSTKVPRNTIRDENSANRSSLESRAVAGQLETSHQEHVLPSPISVFRLSDKNIEKNKIKQRWLLMALLVSVTLRVCAQTSDSTHQNDQTTPSTQTSSQDSTSAPSV